MKKIVKKLEGEMEEKEVKEEEIDEKEKEQINEGEFLQIVLQEINNKTFHLIGSFDEDLLRRFKEFSSNLYFYNDDPNPTVDIHISSRGGQVDVLLAILSEIETIKDMWDCKIHCHIDGYAFSAGALLFLIASDERTMGKHSQMMLHEMSYGVNASIKDHKAELVYTEKLQKRIDNMIIKNTPITTKMLKKWYANGDTFFFKEDLEKLGVLTIEDEEDGE